MSRSPHDTPEPDSSRARAAAAGQEEIWVTPRHGHGKLKPFMPGNQFAKGARPSHFLETQRLAREASPMALKVLIQRLHDPDGRVSVVAANSILERAFGKVREMKPEEQHQAKLDLSKLSDAELGVLMALVERGGLQPMPESGEVAEQEIDGEVSSDS